jgi:hypothetical protein
VRVGRYPVGGEIGIKVGGMVLTITFTQDGTFARVNDGTSLTLTATQAQTALDEPAC